VSSERGGGWERNVIRRASPNTLVSHGVHRLHPDHKEPRLAVYLEAWTSDNASPSITTYDPKHEQTVRTLPSSAAASEGHTLARLVGIAGWCTEGKLRQNNACIRFKASKKWRRYIWYITFSHQLAPQQAVRINARIQAEAYPRIIMCSLYYICKQFWRARTAHIYCWPWHDKASLSIHMGHSDSQSDGCSWNFMRLLLKCAHTLRFWLISAKNTGNFARRTTTDHHDS
jgi:hypothetical protein